MPGFFLALHDPLQGRRLEALEPDTSYAIRGSGHGFKVIHDQDRHAALKARLAILDVLPHSVTLTTFEEQGSTILSPGGRHFHLRSSSAQHSYSILLREDDQFLAGGDRWEVLLDDEAGTLHNSMRPPPIPRPTPETQSQDLLPLTQLLSEHNDLHATTPPKSTNDEAMTQPLSELDDVPTTVLPGSTPDEPPTNSPEQGFQQSDHDDAPAFVPTQSTPDDSPDKPPKEVVQLGPESSVATTTQTLITATPTTPATDYDRETPDNEVDLDDNVIVVSPSDQPQDHVCSTLPEPSTVRERTRKSSSKRSSSNTASTRASKRQKSMYNDPSSGCPTKNIASTESSSGWSTKGATSHPVVYMASTTNVGEERRVMRKFEKMGGRITTNIVEADVLCVGDGPLLRSGSLMLAICSGKDIVTEAWLRASVDDSTFLLPDRYIPKDEAHEKAWQFTLEGAIDRGRAGLSHILEGRVVYITKRLQQSLNDKLVLELKNVATALGAEEVKTSAPSKKAMAEFSDSMLVIGHSSTDPYASKVVDAGIALYSKDLISMAVLRGRLELEEFVYVPGVKSEPA
ncbi:uncharacterized protein AB675_6925 [Cyphellophora attinorum]|uniref:BRCT domain-containing protein n=1 Tax=Cyphellophora attinorum TaxID=1664694 RepID=A0A0N1HDW2_9EURO|nr:uncharacterized protein AB675_6925 [Phialophora attinorum]KPI43363.1 hypothetical protein AB675_6925 [Phialophora attinorum]